jgi:hypothetical protein
MIAMAEGVSGVHLEFVVEFIAIVYDGVEEFSFGGFHFDNFGYG